MPLATGRLLRFALLLAGLLPFGLAVGSAAAQSADGPWPMFRGGPGRTGQAAGPGPAAPERAWTFAPGGWVHASAAIDAAGRVYLGTADRVLALSPDGGLLWSVPTGDEVISSPAVAGGTVYVGALDDAVRALDAATGAEQWRRVLPGDVASSPAVVDGTVYIGSFDGGLHALDAATGTERWRAAIGEVASSPAVAGGTVYVGSLGGGALGEGLYAFDAATGAERWRLGIGEVVASPAVAGGLVFAGSLDGGFYAVDAATGAERWTRAIGSVASSAAVAEGTVYVGSLDGGLYALDAATGAERWRFDAGMPVYASPAIGAGGTLVVAGEGTEAAEGRDARVFALRPPRVEVAVVDVSVDGARVLVRRPDDFSDATTGTLHVRRGGDAAYTGTVALEGAQDGTFDLEAAVPPRFVTLRGLEFYVTLRDGDRTATFPSADAARRPAVHRVTLDAALPDGILAARVNKMISVPADAGGDALAHLVDAYGPPDVLRWRLFQWNDAAGAYDEYPADAVDLTPGAAAFLVTRDAQPFTLPGLRSTDTGGPYEIDLPPGWSQVSNPFAFPVAWDRVTFEPDVVNRSEIVYFDGAASTPRPAVMQPWEGYFVRNPGAAPVHMRVPPEAFDGEAAAPFGPPVANAFHLRAEAAGGTAHAWVGFHDAATASEDGLDFRAPPVPGPAVRLTVVDGGVHLAGSFRPPGAEGSWDLELHAPGLPIGAVVELVLAPAGAAAPAHRAVLVDRDTGAPVALAAGRARLTLGADAVRRLRLTLREADGEAVLPDAPAVLAAPFPNPFAEETTISYHLAAAADAELVVFDALGRRVRVLAEGPRPAGAHAAVWDGRDGAGAAVPSGAYVCRLTVGGAVSTRAVVRVR